ncbi:hypothetical protein [Methylovulum psychrotolerans]|jgi:hypothetical protein|uniref:Uncharacterized protein n=1 Tax=Methylovulum psychrotolerans TaxID=1704499 RepID=A0A1Z4BX35_9GAMM|nr:hypothetical protein [Methylovulum psychrotolerans]ASF45810.1 hypothetical protein CEK71_06830 [Methylovulum psychrotolerans]MBT9097254.1 hypothetical protein [Methylovulum psychrotolerans]
MKKSLFLAMALVFSGSVAAATDHYLLRDGNHIHHLKITNMNDEVTVSADVDFEPNADEAGGHACAAHVTGVAKQVADNELVLKKHSESEASYCELKIHLTPTGATVEQSEACTNFAAGICHFSSDGKEMVKFK